ARATDRDRAARPRVLARPRLLRLHGDAERPGDHEAGGDVRLGDGARADELLPRPRDVRPERSIEDPILAKGALRLHGAQRALADGLLRHPAERRRRARRADPDLTPSAPERVGRQDRTFAIVASKWTRSDTTDTGPRAALSAGSTTS